MFGAGMFSDVSTVTKFPFCCCWPIGDAMFYGLLEWNVCLCCFKLRYVFFLLNKCADKNIRFLFKEKYLWVEYVIL